MKLKSCSYDKNISLLLFNDNLNVCLSGDIQDRHVDTGWHIYSLLRFISIERWSLLRLIVKFIYWRWNIEFNL